MTVDINLATALLYYTQLKERAIGVDFDSDLVIALRGAVDDLALRETAVSNLKVELVLELEKIQELIQAAKVNDADYDGVRELAKTSELAIAMMEVTNG